MKNKTTNIIKKSELKQLIREVISEISYNDPSSKYEDVLGDIIGDFNEKQDEMDYTVPLEELENELADVTFKFVTNFPELQENDFESVARVLHYHIGHDPEMIMGIMKTVIKKLG